MKPKTTLEKLSKKVRRVLKNLQDGTASKKRGQGWPLDLNAKKYGKSGRKSTKKKAPTWGYDP